MSDSFFPAVGIRHAWRAMHLSRGLRMMTDTARDSNRWVVSMVLCGEHTQHTCKHERRCVIRSSCFTRFGFPLLPFPFPKTCRRSYPLRPGKIVCRFASQLISRFSNLNLRNVMPFPCVQLCSATGFPVAAVKAASNPCIACKIAFLLHLLNLDVRRVSLQASTPP